MNELSRRGFLSLGVKSAVLLGAPAIVRAESLMPIQVPSSTPIQVPSLKDGFEYKDGFEFYELAQTGDARKYELVLRINDGPNSLNHLGQNMGRGPQILKKNILMSSTSELLNPEDYASEINYQKAKKSRECVMDLLYQEHLAGRLPEHAWRNKELVSAKVRAYWADR